MSKVIQITNANDLFGKSKYVYQNTTYESGFIFDYWSCSSTERDHNGEKFDGAYPAGFLKRWKYAFVNTFPVDAKILHVCAGRVPKSLGMTLDINPKYNPDFLMNAEDFHKKIDSKYLNYFDWVISDSPYNEDASRKYYGVHLLNKRKMLRAMIAVTKVGGMIGVLDQTMPNQTGLKNIVAKAKIAVSSIPNTDLRVFSVYQKIYSDEKHL